MIGVANTARLRGWGGSFISQKSYSPFISKKSKRYSRQLSAVKLAGDINAWVPDDASLDELLAKIKSELVKLGPLIDLDAICQQRAADDRPPLPAAVVR